MNESSDVLLDLTREKNLTTLCADLFDHISKSERHRADTMRSDRACRSFMVDIKSASYFRCRCGHPKSAHAFFSPLPEEEHFVSSSGIKPKWTVRDHDDSNDHDDDDDSQLSSLSYDESRSIAGVSGISGVDGNGDPIQMVAIPCLDEFRQQFAARSQTLLQPLASPPAAGRGVGSAAASGCATPATDRETSLERQPALRLWNTLGSVGGGNGGGGDGDGGGLCGGFELGVRGEKVETRGARSEGGAALAHSRRSGGGGGGRGGEEGVAGGCFGGGEGKEDADEEALAGGAAVSVGGFHRVERVREEEAEREQMRRDLLPELRNEVGLQVRREVAVEVEAELRRVHTEHEQAQHEALMQAELAQKAVVEAVEGNCRRELEGLQGEFLAQLDAIEVNAQAHVNEVRARHEEQEQRREKRRKHFAAGLQRQVEAQRDELAKLRAFRDQVLSSSTTPPPSPSSSSSFPYLLSPPGATNPSVPPFYASPSSSSSSSSSGGAAMVKPLLDPVGRPLMQVSEEGNESGSEEDGVIVVVGKTTSSTKSGEDARSGQGEGNEKLSAAAKGGAPSSHVVDPAAATSLSPPPVTPLLPGAALGAGSPPPLHEVIPVTPSPPSSPPPYLDGQQKQQLYPSYQRYASAPPSSLTALALAIALVAALVACFMAAAWAQGWCEDDYGMVAPNSPPTSVSSPTAECSSKLLRYWLRTAAKGLLDLTGAVP